MLASKIFTLALRYGTKVLPDGSFPSVTSGAQCNFRSLPWPPYQIYLHFAMLYKPYPASCLSPALALLNILLFVSNTRIKLRVSKESLFGSEIYALCLENVFDKYLIKSITSFKDLIPSDNHSSIPQVCPTLGSCPLWTHPHT